MDLISCIRTSDFDRFLKILRNKNCIINYTEYDGTTPLIEASKNGDCRFIIELLKNGAGKSTDTSYRTPLIYSCIYGHIKNIQFLLMYHGIQEIFQGDIDNISPLMYAAYNGHAQIIKFLLLCGAYVNSYCLSRGTALMLATIGYSTECVLLLIYAGADPNIENFEKLEAIDYCKTGDMLNIYDLNTGCDRKFKWKWGKRVCLISSKVLFSLHSLESVKWLNMF